MDDYDKEALDITVDYLQALGANKMAVAGNTGTSQAWTYGTPAAANSPN